MKSTRKISLTKDIIDNCTTPNFIIVTKDEQLEQQGEKSSWQRNNMKLPYVRMDGEITQSGEEVNHKLKYS